MDNSTALLLELFNDVDPVGLASEYAPDEYMPEVKAFIAAQPDLSNLDDVNRVIKDTFARFFEGVTTLTARIEAS